MNKHIIKGRLVRDPELTPSVNKDSSDRVNFTVAVDRRYGDETDFFDCVCFGKRALVIEKWFAKGQEILLEGEGQLRRYETRDGQKKTAYSIVVADFDFCGSKGSPSDPKPSKAETSSEAWQEQESDILF